MGISPEPTERLLIPVPYPENCILRSVFHQVVVVTESDALCATTQHSAHNGTLGVARQASLVIKHKNA